MENTIAALISAYREREKRSLAVVESYDACYAESREAAVVLERRIDALLAKVAAMPSEELDGIAARAPLLAVVARLSEAREILMKHAHALDWDKKNALVTLGKSAEYMEIKYALIVLPALQALLDTAESGVPVAWAPRLVGKAIELVHFIGLVCGNTGNDTVARELLMHLPAAVVLRVRALESKDCTLMYTCASPRRRADMPAVPLVFSITRASVTVGKKDFSNAHVLGQPKVDEIRSYGPPAKKRRSGDGDYMWEEIDCEFEGRAYCRRAVDVAE